MRLTNNDLIQIQERITIANKMIEDKIDNLSDKREKCLLGIKVQFYYFV